MQAVRLLDQGDDLVLAPVEDLLHLAAGDDRERRDGELRDGGLRDGGLRDGGLRAFCGGPGRAGDGHVRLTSTVGAQSARRTASAIATTTSRAPE